MLLVLVPRAAAATWRVLGASVCLLFPSALDLTLFIYVAFTGTIVNRTYGTHKNLYISPFLLPILGPIYYGPP